VATVYAVEVADGQRAGVGELRMMKAAEDTHRGDYRRRQD
jgi:hypothetical protein